MAEFSNGGSAQPVGMKINEEALAEMIGAIRSRLIFFHDKFGKQGLID
jgi:hypothetical protein